MEGRSGEDFALRRTDPSKYEFVKKVIAGTAFVAPVVVSFSIDGMSISDAKGSITGNTI